MIDEFLSAWFAWQRWCRMKKNGGQERREEQEEIESDQEEDFERER